METQDKQQPSARTAPGPQPAAKLYSIFALQREKSFSGEFETATGKHPFSFTPKSARIENGKLKLSGELSIGRTSLNHVDAVLASTQGGLGTTPAKFLMRPTGLSVGITPTEYTDTFGYVGALYFHLSPLQSKKFGLSIDMSKVQMNVRLYPTNDLEREMQVLYSDIVAAVYGKTKDVKAANEFTAELNKLFT